jgi:hypothetical protein
VLQFSKLNLSCTGDDLVTVRAGSNSSAPVIWQSCYMLPTALPAVVWDSGPASLAVGSSKALFVTFTSSQYRDSGIGGGWTATVVTSVTAFAPSPQSACPGPLFISANASVGKARGCVVPRSHAEGVGGWERGGGSREKSGRRRRRRRRDTWCGAGALYHLVTIALLAWALQEC